MSNSWCLRQEIQVCGLCSTLHVRGVSCYFPDTPPSRVFPFAWVVVSSLLSVSIVTSLQASGMRSAFEFTEMWFLSYDSSKPSPVCVCTCAEHGRLRATHVGCLCLLCSRLNPPHPPGSYRQMEGLGLKPGQEDKARDGKVGTTNEFQRNNSCKKPEEATGKARAAIYGRGLERR